MRFADQFREQKFRLEREGHTVVCPTVAIPGTSPGSLFALYRHKIDAAGRVFVVNVAGYIGESTRWEIEYAEALGKPVEYLTPITPSSSDELARPKAEEPPLRMPPGGES